MLKVLTFSRRKPGATRAEFERYWHDVHVPMWRDIEGIRGYVVSRVVEEHTRSDVAAFGMGEVDGLVEIWYDDEASMQRSASSVAGQAWRTDSAVFIGGMRSFLTREMAAVALPAGRRPRIKALSVVGRRPDQSAADFQAYWSGVHAPMARTVPRLEGFVLSRILRELRRTDIAAIAMDGEPDGFTSSFVDSLAARAELVASREAKPWFADGATFLGRVRTLVVEEQVIAPPPAADPLASP